MRLMVSGLAKELVSASELQNELVKKLGLGLVSELGLVSALELGLVSVLSSRRALVSRWALQKGLVKERALA